MPIDKILEEEINYEIRKLAYPEGTDYVASIALNNLKSRIPQIKERILGEIEKEKQELKHQSILLGDDIGYEKSVDIIINTLKGGKE